MSDYHYYAEVILETLLNFLILKSDGSFKEEEELFSVSLQEGKNLLELQLLRREVPWESQTRCPSLSCTVLLSGVRTLCECVGHGASPLDVFLFMSLMPFGVSESDPLLLLIHVILLL